MIKIDVSGDMKGLDRAFKKFSAQQLPFATALALTRLAQGVSTEETDAVVDTFDSPTPFTQKGFRVIPATKSSQIAYVAAKDITASYLAPYVNGGNRSLGSKRAMLVPRAVATNQYGNLSRNKLKTLKGKPNVFVGQIKTRKGKLINGVWQRPTAAARKGRASRSAQSGLKLLIQFEDTTAAPKHLPFFERARAYLKEHAVEEFAAAMRQALASARR